MMNQDTIFQSRFSYLFFILSLVFMATLITGTVYGQNGTSIEILVPGDFDTAQQAVNAAGPNTTINVGPGIFTEGVFINSKTDLTLRGASITDSVFDGGGSSRPVTIMNSSNITIENFTIRNGSADGSTIEPGRGGGIYIQNSSVKLENLNFESNTSSLGGAVAADYGVLAITNSTFSSNNAYNGGAAAVLDSLLIIENSNISSNTSVSSGGGIYLDGASPDSHITTTIFDSNFTAELGSAIYITSSPREGSNVLAVKGNAIVNNIGFAMFFNESDVRLAQNTFAGNANPITGLSSVLEFSSSNVELINNILTHNSPPEIGGDSSSEVKLSHNNLLGFDPNQPQSTVVGGASVIDDGGNVDLDTGIPIDLDPFSTELLALPLGSDLCTSGTTYPDMLIESITGDRFNPFAMPIGAVPCLGFDSPISDLSLTAGVNNTNPAVGDIVTFTFDILNGGPDDADEAFLEVFFIKRDLDNYEYRFPPGTTLEIDDLGVPDFALHRFGLPIIPAGDTVRIEVDAEVQDNPFSSGGITLQPTVLTNQVDPNNDNNSDTVSLTVAETSTKTADVQVKISENTSALPRDRVFVDYEFANLGPDPVDVASVEGTIPAGLAVANFLASRGDVLFEPGLFRWSLSQISADETNTLEFEFDVVDPSAWGNNITLDEAVSLPAGVSDLDLSNNTASKTITLPHAVDVRAELTTDNPSIVSGDPFSFEFTTDLLEDNDFVIPDPIRIRGNVPSEALINGTSPQTGVQFNEDGFEYEIQNLQPGEARTVQITYESTSDFVGSRTIEVQVDTSGQDWVDTNDVNNAAFLGFSVQQPEEVAADGSGTMTVNPDTVPAGSEGNDLTFTYNTTGTMDGGALRITAPPGWSPPNDTPGAPGETTVDTTGTVELIVFDTDDSGNGRVTVPITRLGAGETIRFTYRDVTAQPDAGEATFVTESRGSSEGDFELLDVPPRVIVTNAANGSGSMTVTPDTVTAGSEGNELVFTYNASGTIDDGAVRITAPPGWSPPNGTPGTPGETTVDTTGTIELIVFDTDDSGNGRATVPITRLGAGETIRITYRDVTAQPDAGEATFVTESRGSSEGTLTPIANSPRVTVSSSVEEKFADLEVSVTLDTDSSGLKPGDKVSHTVIVVNRGEDNATGVSLAEESSALINSSRSILLGEFTSDPSDPNIGIWSIDDLAVGEIAIMNVESVIAPEAAGAQFTYKATVSGNESDLISGNNEVSLSTPVSPIVDLRVSATASDPRPAPGSTAAIQVELEVVDVSGDRPDIIEGAVEVELPEGLTFDPAAQEEWQVTGSDNRFRWSFDLESDQAIEISEPRLIVGDGTAGMDLPVEFSLDISGTNIVDPNPDNDTFTLTITPVEPPIVDLELRAIASDPRPAPGGTVSVQVELEVVEAPPAVFTGNISGTIQATLPEGVTYDPTTQGEWQVTGSANVLRRTFGLEPDQQIGVFEITLRVEDDTAGMDLPVELRLMGTNYTDSNPDNDVVTVNITPIAITDEADLEVVKTVSNETPEMGEEITYTLTVTNNGPGNATGVKVEDHILDNSLVEYASVTTSKGGWDPDKGIWTIGELNAQDSVTMTLNVKVNPEPLVPNLPILTKAVVSGNEHDPDESNNSAFTEITPKGEADLEISVSSNREEVKEGEEVDFIILVNNLGPTTDSEIQVSNPIPTGTTFVEGQADHGTYDSQSGIWDVGFLTGNANAKFNLTVVVDQGLAGQSIINEAEVLGSYDPNNENNMDFAEVPVIQKSADLKVDITIDRLDPIPGDDITYTITVMNNGPDDATGVSLSETFPTLINIFDLETHGEWQPDPDNPNSAKWLIGKLASGESAKLTLEGTVPPGTTGTELVHEATVSGNEPDPIPDNNRQSLESLVSYILDLALDVTPNTINPVEGGMVIFNVEVQVVDVPEDMTDPIEGIIEAILPAGLTFDQTTSGEWVPDDDDILISRTFSLQPGQQTDASDLLLSTADGTAGMDLELETTLRRLGYIWTDRNTINDKVITIIKPVAAEPLRIISANLNFEFLGEDPGAEVALEVDDEPDINAVHLDKLSVRSFNVLNYFNTIPQPFVKSSPIEGKEPYHLLNIDFSEPQQFVEELYRDTVVKMTEDSSADLSSVRFQLDEGALTGTNGATNEATNLPLRISINEFNLSPGDANGNGESDFDDVQTILNVVVHGNEASPLADLVPPQAEGYYLDDIVIGFSTDANRDGNTNSADGTYLLTEVTGNPQPIFPAPANITIHRNASTRIISYNGQTLEVSIDLDDIKYVYSADVIMRYNPQMMEVTGVSGAPAISEWLSAHGTTESGELRIALAGTSEPMEGGSLITVSFDVSSPEAVSQLDIIKFDINGGQMKPTLRNLPKSFALLQNYPNPFNPETWIPYHLSRPSDVSIVIYNSTGQIVRRLELGNVMPGEYVDRSQAAYWDGRNEVGEQVSSGIYFYQLRAGQDVSVKKMIIAK